MLSYKVWYVARAALCGVANTNDRLVNTDAAGPGGGLKYGACKTNNELFITIAFVIIIVTMYIPWLILAASVAGPWILQSLCILIAP